MNKEAILERTHRDWLVLILRGDTARQTEDTFDALVEGGGEPGRCGWLKDRFGLSWQVVPREMGAYLGGPDAAGAARAMEAMLRMETLDVAMLRDAYEGRS